jgi:putative alpha-1,2-mannosidase
MGNFPIFAQGSCPHDDIHQCQWQQSDRAVVWDKKSIKARPGYFGISLANGVHAEMTTTNRSALYRFTFNETSNQPLSPVVLLDLIDLPQSRFTASADVDRKTGRLTGNGTFGPSFGIGSYKSYVCVDFKGAELRDTGTWTRNQVNTSGRTLSLGYNIVSTVSAGTFARFHAPKDNKSILARVGVSFISVQQACSNAEREQPNFDFEGTVHAAESAWRKKLDVISVNAEGVSSDLQKVFWSGAYRTMISPQDYTGENPLWKSDEPYYDSYYW